MRQIPLNCKRLIDDALEGRFTDRAFLAIFEKIERHWNPDPDKTLQALADLLGGDNVLSGNAENLGDLILKAAEYFCPKLMGPEPSIAGATPHSRITGRRRYKTGKTLS